MPAESGRLYGLGVGPGDPELLTLKALRLLRAVPVVAYPAPENGDSFARSIVAAWIEGHQCEIAILFPMRPGPPPVEIYDGAAAELAAQLDAGHDVALLCQGDPLFYGSFVNVFTRLVGRYRIEIVPGISSVTACAAAAEIPLLSSRSGAISQRYGRYSTAWVFSMVRLTSSMRHCRPSASPPSLPSIATWLPISQWSSFVARDRVCDRSYRNVRANDRFLREQVFSVKARSARRPWFLRRKCHKPPAG